jgi:hypothetical protein
MAKTGTTLHELAAVPRSKAILLKLCTIVYVHVRIYPGSMHTLGILVEYCYLLMSYRQVSTNGPQSHLASHQTSLFKLTHTQLSSLSTAL